jgi:alpha-tubulin suppressor-like RCC1 family protein
MNRIAVSNKKLFIATLLFGMSSTACGPDADLDKGFSCTTQADCAAGFLCFSSTCEKIVASASECAAGKVFAPQANVCAKPTCENGLQQSACAPDSPLLKTIDFYCRIGQDCAAQFTCFAERCEAQASAQLDCRPGKAFVESLSLCVTPSCSNGVQDAFEGGVDCGSGCAQACSVTESCSDNLQNQGETGVDCGGPCVACATCVDGIMNGGEEGVDCGGPCVRSCSGCGNGTVDVGEACDHGGTPSAPCEYGRTSCTTCGPMCQFEAGTPEFCGDGSVQIAAGEECDHSGAPQVSCQQGTQSCMVCNAQCNLVPGLTEPFCGDKIVQNDRGEECDHQETSLDCEYGEISCQKCSTECHFIDGNIIGYCGDGIIQLNEDCDSENYTKNCKNYNKNYGKLNCNSFCKETNQNCFNFSLISAGIDNTCAVNDMGDLYCWGSNNEYQLARSSIINTYPNYAELSLTNQNILSIDTYSRSTCFLSANGSLKCFGYNGQYQLGNGTTTNSYVPIDVTNLSSNVINISISGIGGCVTMENSTARCWGDGAYGRLGNGTTNSSRSPIVVQSLGGLISQIETNSTHTCVLMEDTSVKCWGFNSTGQLGDGTYNNSLTPVQVTNLIDVKKISLGSSHSCALLNSGHVQCWGSNIQGQLGNGTFVSSTTPVNVQGLADVKDIYSGLNHNCASLNNGQFKCWGGNTYGQLGIGNKTNQNLPQFIVGISNVLSYSSQLQHSCAIDIDGKAYCWGSNNAGQLGDGTRVERLIPTLILVK